MNTDRRSRLPPKVAAALEVLELYRYVEFPDSGPFGSGLPSEAPTRTLPRQVAVARDAALEVVRLYLSGEMDYVEPPPASRSDGRVPGDGEEPTARSPAPTH